MERGIKREFLLHGLNCAHCSSKIEEQILRLNGVKEVSLNFVTKTLIVFVDKEVKDVIDEEIKKVVKSIEAHVEVSEKKANKGKVINLNNTSINTDKDKNGEMKKIVFVVKGLNCAHCAGKIEDEIRKLENIDEANLDFVGKKIILKTSEKDEDNLLNTIQNIVDGIEHGVTIGKSVKKTKPQKLNNKVNEASCSDKACECEGHNHKGDHSHSHDNKHNEHDHEEHDHNHDHGAEGNEFYIKLGVGIAFFIGGLFLKQMAWLQTILFIISYILVGGEVLVRAFKNILRGQVFDENFLMSIATIGAFAINQYSEAVGVMIFYQVGEMLQGLAVNRSRKSISELMDIRPDSATIVLDGKEIKVEPEEVEKGQIIIVKPGEKVPLDGIVIEGEAQMDTSALTGESLPRGVKVGAEVIGGFINKNGVIKVEVTKEFGESTVAKILDLVENAGAKKATTEKFITKFARYYTPVVVILALILAIGAPLVLNEGFYKWIYRALSFLVVSCPCALVISIPLGFFGGIGAASKNGILIKGGNYLEALNKVEAVVFDKTGTLTEGVFEVTTIENMDWISKEELLKYAAYAEGYSNHPIAESIKKHYKADVDKSKLEGYYEHSGHGVEVNVDNRKVFLGNIKLMESKNIKFKENNEMGTKVYVAIDGKFAGCIVISDRIKKDAKEAIQGLKAAGVKNTVMLTGDNKHVAENVANNLGLDSYYAELLPQQKVEKLESLMESKSKEGKIIFVGDGINDAPVLARADIGIAMGGVGSDAAIEAADVVIMTDEPYKIKDAIRIAKKTNTIVWQNIIFSLGVKAIILVLVALGMSSMWEAVFGDVGVALIAILNSMRILRYK